MSKAIVQNEKDPSNTFFLFKMDGKTGQAAVFPPCGPRGGGRKKRRRKKSRVRHKA